MYLYPYYEDEVQIIYDELKPDYKRNFVEPVPFTHRLTDKEEEKGKYKRYFLEILNIGSIIEIDNNQYKYYKKDSTPYHKNIAVVEIELMLSTKSIDINKAAIREAGKIIKQIHKHVLPTKYMWWPQLPKGIMRDGDLRKYADNGENVPGGLPGAYQLGNDEEQENKVIPAREHCAGCLHWRSDSEEKGICRKWAEAVRPNYWCASYAYDLEDDDYYRPEISTG